MTLHVLNFIAPLTPSRNASSSLGGYSSGVNNVRKVDVTSPGVRAVLKAIETAEGFVNPAELQHDQTNGASDEEAFALLQALGMPFRKDGRTPSATQA